MTDEILEEVIIEEETIVTKSTVKDKLDGITAMQEDISAQQDNIVRLQEIIIADLAAINSKI
jgi:hypothetical protein